MIPVNSNHEEITTKYNNKKIGNFKNYEFRSKFSKFTKFIQSELNYLLCLCKIRGLY